MAVVVDAGSAGATEVEERVAVPDKVAVLDEVAWGKSCEVVSWLPFPTILVSTRSF